MVLPDDDDDDGNTACKRALAVSSGWVQTRPTAPAKADASAFESRELEAAAAGGWIGFTAEEAEDTEAVRSLLVSLCGVIA